MQRSKMATSHVMDALCMELVGQNGRIIGHTPFSYALPTLGLHCSVLAWTTVVWVMGHDRSISLDITRN